MILLRRPGGDLRELAGEAFTQIERRAPGSAFIAVGVVWSVLALSERWGPEKSWVDRLGRLLGTYWVAYPILSWVVELVSAG